MSRVGKQLIAIPEGTQVNISGGRVLVKGPQGEISRAFKPAISILVEGDHVRLSPRGSDLSSKALWGTYAAHLLNMIQGVNKHFEKQLLVEGVGFKAEVSGDNLNMSLGFSHPVKLKIPQGLKVSAEKNVVTISGADVEEVGRFSAEVRSKKPPEPYKGKGIRYRSEVIRRKEGKKSA